jgi:hypothetical protein
MSVSLTELEQWGPDEFVVAHEVHDALDEAEFLAQPKG